MRNLYIPYQAVIRTTRDETYDTRTFGLALDNGKHHEEFQYKPGQFVEVSLLGYGESPISIASSPSQKGHLELCVRRVGHVTEALHRLSEDDIVGIRGPFGNGFPVEEMTGKNLVFVGGGLGLAPLRSLINTVFANRGRFGKVTILYGARTPSDLLFQDELAAWGDKDNTEVLVTVDVGSGDWQGNVGVVTTLFNKTAISIHNTIAIICGPPIMFRFVIQELLKIGFSEEAIMLTLERLMKCGLGKCGHCNIGSKYVCLDGPVFTYKELKGLPGAL
jgi:sulfite reductase subunit B